MLTYIGSLLSGNLDLSAPVSNELTVQFYTDNIQNSPMTILLYTAIFDAFDYISGNILFVLTALGSAIFVGFVLKEEAQKELGANETFTKIWFNYVKYVIPVIIIVIFINSL